MLLLVVNGNYKTLICVEYQKDGGLVVECDVSTPRYTMFKYPHAGRLYGLLTAVKEGLSLLIYILSYSLFEVRGGAVV
jgi:hypothetical protein